MEPSPATGIWIRLAQDQRHTIFLGTQEQKRQRHGDLNSYNPETSAASTLTGVYYRHQSTTVMENHPQFNFKEPKAYIIP